MASISTEREGAQERRKFALELLKDQADKRFGRVAGDPVAVTKEWAKAADVLAKYVETGVISE